MDMYIETIEEFCPKWPIIISFVILLQIMYKYDTSHAWEINSEVLVKSEL